MFSNASSKIEPGRASYESYDMALQYFNTHRLYDGRYVNLITNAQSLLVNQEIKKLNPKKIRNYLLFL